MTQPDLEFFFDPACPFCWITSKWVRVVRDELDLDVRWSYISLVTLNEPFDDDDHREGAMRGRRAQRVIAAAAAAHGEQVVGPLYEAIGNATWEADGDGFDDLSRAFGELDFARILSNHDLDPAHADAVTDDTRDHLFEAGTKEALARTGDDVGTPIITFRPGTDEAASFFGPVISDVPSAEDSVTFYRAIEQASRVAHFAELKRSLRQKPRLPVLG